ncbi:HotDog domain-containing protein [Apiospora marii]|uniref:HotDog domain-containing protein n=1 Tax=Apiospora marii TaxID=335849 RepID=UPI0031309846
MATRHAATLTCGRRLVRLCHHESHGLRASLSMVKQKREFSNSRRLSLSPSQSPQQASPSPAAAQAPLDIERLRAEMLSRPEQLTYDALTNIPSYLFDLSLSEYLDGDSTGNGTPQPQPPPLPHLRRPPPRPPPPPLPPALPPSRLCPDGTDPYHSPGLPFERRMWAGGSIEFPGLLRQNGTPAVCAERIQDVQVRGPAGDEKVFVEVLRRYGRASRQGDRGPFELCQIPYKPTHAHPLTPDRTLLFHFSALSYNAHLIHLDERYSQDVERRPGLLVHGPLCLNLLLEVLRRSCRQPRHPGESAEDVASRELTVQRIDYRNLAPLYADQEMTVCVRSPPKRKLRDGEAEQQKHDVWIENQHGGLCVKGTVLATERAMTKMERFHKSFAKRMANGEFN